MCVVSGAWRSEGSDGSEGSDESEESDGEEIETVSCHETCESILTRAHVSDILTSCSWEIFLICECNINTHCVL